MGKIVMLAALILLSLFAVYVANMGMKSKSVDTGNAINDPYPMNPSPLPDQTLSAVPSKDSSSSSQTENITATIKTSKGDIVLTLFPNEAPNTVNNFVEKAKSGFYNNLTFHRVEDWVIQGGDPLGNGTGGGNMPTELNGKPFTAGSLGVARGGDIKISNDAQFFITKTDASWLNGQYTNFGIVTGGTDTVSNIQIGDKILGITTE